MAFRRTFDGGAVIGAMKHTVKSPVQRIAAPALLTLSLRQYDGSFARPIVTEGEEVLVGSRLADGTGEYACPLHAPVSGKVEKISREALVLRSDERMRRVKLHPFPIPLSDAQPEQIAEFLAQTGICEIPDGYPADRRLRDAMGRVDTLLIHGVEPDPGAAAAVRLLMERPDAVVGGAKILLKALGLRRGTIAVSDVYMEAVNSLAGTLAESDLLRLVICRSKYPQNMPSQLIMAVTGRALPATRKPTDVHCALFRAETCAMIYDAFAFGLPMTEILLTAAGPRVRQGRNLAVPLGTPIEELAAHCGGLRTEKGLTVRGGLMTGTVCSPDETVDKTTYGVFFLPSRKPRDGQCIRCGRCAEICPMRLLPLYLSAEARAGHADAVKKLHITACTDCGLCAACCPAGVPLTADLARARILAAESAEPAEAPAQKKTAASMKEAMMKKYTEIRKSAAGKREAEARPEESGKPAVTQTFVPVLPTPEERVAEAIRRRQEALLDAEDEALNSDEAEEYRMELSDLNGAFGGMQEDPDHQAGKDGGR